MGFKYGTADRVREGERSHGVRRVLSALTLMTAVSAASVLPASATEGKDTETRTIRVKDGSSVSVTASAYAPTKHSGNRTRVIHGRKVADTDWVDSEFATTVPVAIDSPGTHTIKAACHNQRADAESCSISIERIEVY